MRSERESRLPFVITNREAGVVTIVFQIVGASTQRMSELKAGDAFEDVVGPLGRHPNLYMRTWKY